MANGHSSHDSRSVGASTPKVESVKTTHNSPPRSSPDSSTCGEPLDLLNYIKHNGASPFVERHQENINQPLQHLHTKQPDFYGHDNLPLFESHMSLSPEHRLDDSTTRDTETSSRGRSVVDRASTAQSNSDRSLQENARQDSGYHDEKIDVELQARNIRARERVEIHRGRVWRTRRLLNESRQDVQKPRARLRDATAELMAALDTLMATGDLHQLESLVPFHQEVRGAQDELGPLEDVLDTLEIRLNHEESELEQEEMHFYRNYNISLEPPSDSKLDEPLSPLYKPYEPDDEYDDLDLENELVQQYLSSKGEAENLKEKIDELEDEQYRISTERTFRTRYNLPLSEENSKFLLTFPDTHKEALDKLQLLEDQLAELRQRCLENELFGEDDYLYEPRDAFVEEVMDSVNEALERSPLRAASLQHTPTLSSREKNYSDKREYVNDWLLEWVQDSMLEAHMLKEWIYSEYPASRDGLAAEQWPTLALEFWDSDKAGEKTNLFYELDTREAVSGSQTSRGSSLDANIEDDILGSFENFCYSGSDGASQRTQRGAHIVGSSKASSW